MGISRLYYHFKFDYQSDKFLEQFFYPFLLICLIAGTWLNKRPQDANILEDVFKKKFSFKNQNLENSDKNN